MRHSLMALLATAIAATSTATMAQGSGVNVGSLQCRVSGGMGFVFGSSKDMECLLVRPDGSGERYVGTINKYGVDIGFTKEAQMVWLVFAPGAVARGALAGDYGGATASATVGAGVGANVLLGGSNKQITLQPVSVEGSAGLNVAAGVAAVTLRPAAPAR
ncbi:MAG TPA: DUF992 domain-containing protein [Reyranella sp.]|nr:DUF992 domain-containing protein [Reyranella sp.]